MISTYQMNPKVYVMGCENRTGEKRQVSLRKSKAGYVRGILQRTREVLLQYVGGLNLGLGIRVRGWR